MRIATLTPGSLPEPSAPAAERVDAGGTRASKPPGPLPSTDVVHLSDAARAWLEPSASSGSGVELGATPARLWEEARQSLLRDPMEPEPGEEALGPHELSDEDQAVVDELRARDAEVRAHEAAHAAIGGGVPTYVYQRGPDGKRYAVGGEVTIEMGGGSTAQGTIDRMRRVRAAALAPGSPSVQDLAVAAEATQREAAAGVRKNKAQTARVVHGSEARTTPGEPQRAAAAFDAQQRAAEPDDPPSQTVWA